VVVKPELKMGLNGELSISANIVMTK
jgi:hypothetical protein